MVQWIVIANQENAKIFLRIDNSESSRLLTEFENQLSHEKVADLVRHQTGFSMKTSGHKGGVRHRAVGKKDVKETIKDQFAKRVCDFINEARSKKEFDYLSVVAEPRMLGEIQKHLSKQTLPALTKSLTKDFRDADYTTLEKYIAGNEDLRIPVS